MRERKHDPQPLPVYESHPPGWLPKAHNAVDLGTVNLVEIWPRYL